MTEPTKEPKPPKPKENLREEARVHLNARKELGAEFDDELVDAFLEKVQRDRGLGQSSGESDPPRRERRGRLKNPVGLVAVLMCFGIPLTAIVAGSTGLWGVVAVWGAIAFLVVWLDRR